MQWRFIEGRAWSQCCVDEGGTVLEGEEHPRVTQGFSWMIYTKHLIACDSHETPTEWTERVTDFIRGTGRNMGPVTAAGVVIRITLNRRTVHGFVKAPGD